MSPDCATSRSRSALDRRRFLLSAAGLLGTGTRLLARQEPTFSTDVRVVNILAFVLDKKGEIVRDLTVEDFALLENGRPQNIKYFAKETDLPLTLGLMVDTSLSQTRVMEAERGASFHFLDRVLRETKDQVFIMTFDTGALLRQALTSSRKELDAALSLVDTPSRGELMAQGTAETNLYDAVVKACTEIMQKRTNRKALILLTDGGENGSDASQQDAIAAAVKADTLIYSVYYADPSYGMMGGGPDGRRILQNLSQETGGGFFEVSKKQNIEQVFDLIQQELRSQYNLGYVSDVPVQYPEFRKIQLTAKQKGLKVRARDRYWAHF
jgi:VWFA-related protein